jgi:hypothetical protein
MSTTNPTGTGLVSILVIRRECLATNTLNNQIA